MSTKWERNALRPQLVNGQDLRDWKKTTVYEFVNQLGEEGWELANATENYRFIFKRPKP